METIEQLRSRIDSAEGLYQVVKTMKGIAAVNLRQYQQADASVAEYAATVEQGLQILLSASVEQLRLRPNARISEPTVLAVVFGSDQGMVGQFNSRILRHCLDVLADLGADRDHRWIVVIGRRLAGRMQSAGENALDVYDLPRSADAIAAHTQRLLPAVQALHERGAHRVVVLHNLPTDGASYQPATQQVFPLSLTWLAELRHRPWPGPSLPTFRITPGAMLAELVGHYLFVSLFRAFAGSLAAENASRLASMQAAERNIEDRLDTLRHHYHRLRQSQITSELLDVIAGFETAGKG